MVVSEQSSGLCFAVIFAEIKFFKKVVDNTKTPCYYNQADRDERYTSNTEH